MIILKIPFSKVDCYQFSEIAITVIHSTNMYGVFTMSLTQKVYSMCTEDLQR